MNPEHRLRDAAKTYTDQIQPTPDAWARVRERVDAEPRRRRVPAARVALAGFATAIVVALLVTLVAAVRDEGNGGTGVTAGPAGAPPREIVAVTGDGRLVVLDTATGEESRTLADGADRQTTIAVTPDGERVFFDRPSTGASGPPREIVTVPAIGGELRRIVGESAQPAVSPDGTKLAFVSYQGPAGPTAPQLLQVIETDSILGTPERVGYWEVGDAAEQVVAPSWAPDSRHLVYTVFNSPEGSYPRILDTTDDSLLLDQARIVPIFDGSAVSGYLGQTGQLLGRFAAGGDDPDQRVRVIAIDPTTGREARHLFRFPEPCCGQSFVADPSGRHVLGVGLGLYAWSDGAGEVRKVSNTIVGAAWVPAAPPGERVAVPDVLGLSEAGARTLLTQAGLPAEVVYAPGIVSRESSVVVEQEPPAGVSVRSGSAVELTVGPASAPR